MHVCQVEQQLEMNYTVLAAIDQESEHRLVDLANVLMIVAGFRRHSPLRPCRSSAGNHVH